MARNTKLTRRPSRRLGLVCIVALGVLDMTPAAYARAQSVAPSNSATSATRADPAEYVVGPADVLSITVRNQPNLSSKFTVETDGKVNFPLVGRVNAGGMTLRAIEAELSKRLADGFFNNPEISITIDAYRSQRVVVMGEVQQQGPFPLTGRTTILEVLAVARPTATASKEALIVRPAPGRTSSSPALPGDGGDEQVISVDLNLLETGNLTNNIVVQDGDTILIPRAATVVVFGQVRSPGVYPIQKGTTLYTVLAMAGGVTDAGSLNRIDIKRTVDGKQKDIKLKLSDVLQAGDTIIAKGRLF